jgi:uncharacterized protein YxjI
MPSFPLTFKFRLVAIAPQLSVTDSTGAEVCYVKQKAFKLRESVSVFRDASQKTLIAKIEADRIIDWSARYIFHDADGRRFGAVGRRGARSLFKAHYDIFADADSREASMTIEEESFAMRMFDNIFEQIPVIGMFSGYLFHPSYAVKNGGGETVARLRKKAALLEGRFELERVGDLTQEQESEILLSCLMMILLERSRG